MSSTTKNVCTPEDPIKSLEVKFDNCMKSFEAKLSAARPSTVQQLAAEFAQFRDTMVSALQVLKGQVAALNQITDDLDNRSRCKFLLFRGIAETEDDLLPTICNIVTDKLKIPSQDFAVNEIRSCYRVGSPGDSSKPRPVLVKFSKLSTRKKIWQSKKLLKGSSVSIAEFLTARRRNLFKEARSVLGMQRCWSSEGVIYVKDDKGVKIRLTSMQQLSELSQVMKATPRDGGRKPGGRAARPGRKA